MTAAGCAGFGHELVRWGGLDAFGALVTPSLTHEAQAAAQDRRLIETPSGVVHPHDTPNVGTQSLSATRLPWEVTGQTPVVVSVTGATSGEMADAAADVRRRTATRGVLGVEVNLSVPNEANSSRPFARDEYAATKTIARVREHLPRNLLLFAKLTVGTEVVDIARGVLKSGADVIVVGHPPAAASIDVQTLRPRTLGPASLAGPALLPLTLGAVFELRAAMHAGRLPTAPIVAGGGVARAGDVIQALASGASAVQIGTALFRDPLAGVGLRDGVEDFLSQRSLTLSEVVGAAHR